jgi:hypothetical protein
MHDVAFRNTFPTPHALRPNICNSCFEANLTKIDFANCGPCCATIISSSHSHWALARMQLLTF